MNGIRESISYQDYIANDSTNESNSETKIFAEDEIESPYKKKKKYSNENSYLTVYIQNNTIVKHEFYLENYKAKPTPEFLEIEKYIQSGKTIDENILKKYTEAIDSYL